MSSFDQWVDRSGGVFWLKPVLTPDAIKAQGERGFSGAEFEFPSCPAFCRGVAEAAIKGSFGFTLPGSEYKSHVQWWMKHVRGFDMNPDWLVTVQGTIFSLATTIRLVTQPGESIIVLTPGYNRYEQAAVRLGRTAVKVALHNEDGVYSIDLEALEAAMAVPKNRLLVLTNPNNPTGNIVPRDTLEKIAELAEKYDIMLFSDEIFAEVLPFGGRVTSLCEVTQGRHSITCTGMGKVFSLTGVNHANLIIPDAGLRERYTAQRNADHYGSLDPMAHAGLISAYNEEGAAWVRGLNDYIAGNVNLAAEFMKENWPEVTVTRPEGTFVLWLDYGNTGKSREELNALLEQSCFAGDWGEEYYGTETQMRYSVAVPREGILRPLEKLKKLLKEKE